MRQRIRSRRPIKAPTGAFPPNKSAGLSARSCVTFQVHEAILWAIFLPQQNKKRKVTSAEPKLFGVYAVDLLSRWRALRGFRKTLEDDHD